MAIAIALLGFNGLGRSVTLLFFSETDFMNEQKIHVGSFSRFLSMGHGILPSYGCKACETMVAKCELVL